MIALATRERGSRLRCRVALAAGAVAAAASMPLYGQQSELEEGLRYLLDNALEIRIGMHVDGSDRRVVWDSQQVEVTIPGRAVQVHLSGDNLRVEALFTPYVNADGDITLVAQGQVWHSDAADEEVRYAATYRSVPIGIGEKLMFFPLGVAERLASEVTLRLEVEIAPFVFDTDVLVDRATGADQT